MFFLPFPGTIPIFFSWNIRVLSFLSWEFPCSSPGSIPACMFPSSIPFFSSHNLPTLLLAASQPFPLGASTLLPLFTAKTSLPHFFSSSAAPSVRAEGTCLALVLLDPEQNVREGKNTALCLPSPEPKLLGEAEGAWLLRVPRAPAWSLIHAGMRGLWWGQSRVVLAL